LKATIAFIGSKIIVALRTPKTFVMPFTINFAHPTSMPMTAEKYELALKKLEEAGSEHPKGKSFHVSYGDPNNLSIMDIWDNMEDFQEFGKTLMPILHELSVDPGEPLIEPVYSIIQDTVGV